MTRPRLTVADLDEISARLKREGGIYIGFPAQHVPGLIRNHRAALKVVEAMREIAAFAGPGQGEVAKMHAIRVIQAFEAGE